MLFWFDAMLKLMMWTLRSKNILNDKCAVVCEKDRTNVVVVKWQNLMLRISKLSKVENVFLPFCLLEI